MEKLTPIHVMHLVGFIVVWASFGGIMYRMAELDDYYLRTEVAEQENDLLRLRLVVLERLNENQRRPSTCLASSNVHPTMPLDIMQR